MEWLDGYGSDCRMMVALVFGSIMVARSPASAIAVVRELNAHGPLTSCMLGVTVVGDVVVLLLFTLSSSLALAVCSGDGFQGAEFLLTILSLVLAIGFGYLVGYFFILLLWLPRAPWAKHFILPCGLFIFILCDWFELYSSSTWGVAINFDALLICITAGYVVTNQSHNRMTFMLMLGRFAPYVFIPFFTKVGVELNLTVLYRSIGFAIIVFFVRAACMFAGGWTGGKISGLGDEHCQLVWLTMISQAGVSLGLASEVAVKFQQSFGPDFQTAVVAVVICNQLVGPVLCKYAIKRAKENDRLGPDGLPIEESSNGLNGAPDLQLSYEHEEIPTDTFDGDATNTVNNATGGVHQRRRSSYSRPNHLLATTHVTNIHGQRMRKSTRKRALVLGCSSASLTAVRRLLDCDVGVGVDDWSVVLLDDSLEGVARAAAFLATQSRVKRERDAIFDPLPSLMRNITALAQKTQQGLEHGLDQLLPAAHMQIDEGDEDRLMGSPQHTPGGAAGADTAAKSLKIRSSSDVDEDELDLDDDDATVTVPPPSGKVHRPPPSALKHSGGSGASNADFTELQDVDFEEDASPDVGVTVASGPVAAIASPAHIRPIVHIPGGEDSLPVSPNAASNATHSAGGMSRVQVHRLNLENHRSYLDAYRAIEEEFFLSREGVDATLIDVHMDSVAYDLAAYLTDKRRFNRVVARVKHPGWARVIAGLGCIPIYALSVEAQLVSSLLSGTCDDSRGVVAFTSASPSYGVNGGKVDLSEIIADTVLAEDDLTCAMHEMDENTRSESSSGQRVKRRG